MLLGLQAVGASAQPAPAAPETARNSPASANALPGDSAGYVARAGGSDLREIESSQAVLATSTNAEVKRFAQMMIRHRGQSTEKVKAAALAAGLTVAPPALDAAQQQMLSEIQRAKAADVDAIYEAHQKRAHDAALALYSNYAEKGYADSLKAAAREITPVVQAHRAELDRLPPKR